MNINRLIQVAVGLMLGSAGAILGRSLQEHWPDSPFPMPALFISVACALLGWGPVAHRLSYLLNNWREVPAVDRLLGALGAFLGLFFGVLITLPLPGGLEEPLWLLLKLGILLLSAGFGVAAVSSLRTETLRLLPQLDKGASSAMGASCRAKILDTNVIIDGRMADLYKTGFVEGPIYVPNFVLDEVQYIADSADSTRRARGRRGLEILNTMHEFTIPQHLNGQASDVPMVHVLNEIPASVQKIETVDNKLVHLAKEMGASIVTNDFNLNRVAELQGVQVLNINELAQSLKPVVLPGEEMNLLILKEGKEAGQGVGYLADGTMVVVSDGQRHVGETCKVVISSVYQTVAGKMIFADIKGMKGAGDDLFNDNGGRKKK